MFPFGAYTGTPEPKRTINLGGASASTTSLTPDAIFSSVQAARNARQEHKARTSAAVEVQRWWRGEKERRRVKEGLLTLFLESVGNREEGMDVDAGSATGRDEMTALRCLVLIGHGRAGEQALEMWAGQVLRQTGTRGVDTLWRPDDTSRPIPASTRDSYEVLIRQTAVLLLESVARDPISSRSASFLTILRALLFPGDDTTPSPPSPASPSASKSAPKKPIAKPVASAPAASAAKISERAQACARLTRYLLSKGLYDLLAQAIKGVPATAVAADSPTAHAASALIELSVLPLTTFASSSPSSANSDPNSMLIESDSSSPNLYLPALTQLVTRILSIPLLPNRLPLAALPRLVGALPLQKFDVLAPRVDAILTDSASFTPPGPSATLAPTKLVPHKSTGACPSEIRGTTAEDKLHLLANLHLFASPHYKLMSATAMETYLRLTAGLLDRLPGGVLTKKGASEKSKTAKGKEKEKGANGAKGLKGDKGKGKHVTKKQRLLGSAANESASNSNSAYSSMDESDPRPAPTTRVVVVDSFDTDPSVAAKRAKEENITVDAKTAARLSKLASQAHLSALTGAAGGKRGVFPALVGYLFSLTTAFGSSPASASGGLTSSHAADGAERAERDRATGPAAEAEKSILNHLLASTGGGLVREVYRDLVRRGTLGKEDVSGPVYAGRGASGSIMDQSNASQWPALLFLADLYSQALLTMGDDEFFGVAGSASAVGSAFSSASANVNPNNTARVARNPLTLDELTEFSRQLLNIAFALYYREDSNGGGVGSVMQQDVVEGMRCTWEAAREKVTRCLVGIHARDSRKPFVPVDHWLATAHLDMHSFVEAAVLEEQQLSNADSNNDEHLAISLPTRGPRRSYNNRQLSKRQIAAMSPRLGVLNNIPFAIPFEVRVSIFRHFVMNDMMARSGSTDSFGRRFGGPWGMGGKARVQVRRGMVAQDGFDRLGEVDLKAPIEITFIDQFGQEEAGIDGGGVFKEFFTSLCQEVFDTDRGLWLANKKNELYPNPHAYATEAHSLNWYRFIGRILGKAMYEGILVDVAFAGFFLAKWLGRQSFLDDLSSLDPDLYNGLIFLKHFTGNVEDLSLNFAMAVDEFGVTKSVDLIPNGSNIAVTKENRLQYIYCVSHYRLSKQIKAQSAAFFEGLSEMIDQKWLRMFNQQEVQILIGGVNAPIDLDDLRKHTNYGGLYDDGHEVVRMFWSVVNDFDQEQRRALLRFVTSCSRPPLLGFKELVPNFSIRDAGSDQYRLPTSSTCVNLLKLPRYNNPTTLRQKLLQAINSNAGFDLS